MCWSVYRADKRRHRAMRALAEQSERVRALLRIAAKWMGARTAGWDVSGFESSWCPAPEQLEALRAGASAALGRRSAARLWAA